MLRTSNLEAEKVSGGSELQILRAEVANAGAREKSLQGQLKQSEAEMEEMGTVSDVTQIISLKKYLEKQVNVLPMPILR